jgi:hypothetical protein
MALLVDSDVASLAAMTAIDPEVPEIAEAEGIVVDGDGGIVRESWHECLDALLMATERFAGSGSRLRAETVVATSAVRRWMLYHALAMFYRAATNRRTSDRYERKLERARSDERTAFRRLWHSGVPVTVRPLPRPGALHVAGAGRWSEANITLVPLPSGGDWPEPWPLEVSISWLDAGDGRNGESAASDTAAVIMIGNHGALISIDGLSAPARASHWRLYGAIAGAPLTLQATIPIATTSWLIDTYPTTSGAPLPLGQSEEDVVPLQAVLSRG